MERSAVVCKASGHKLNEIDWKSIFAAGADPHFREVKISGPYLSASKMIPEQIEMIASSIKMNELHISMGILRIYLEMVFIAPKKSLASPAITQVASL